MGIEYTEKIDMTRAEFICSLKAKDKEKLIWDDCEGNQSNKGEPYMPKKTYLKSVTEYCSNALNNDGKTTIRYDYSKRMITDGRMFSQQFSMQGMEKKLRAFLSSGLYKDYDIWNAHFCIITSILLETLGEDEVKKTYPMIWTYVQSQRRREYIWRITECDKIELLGMLNSGFCPEDCNENAKRFNYECKQAQELLWSNTPQHIKKYECFKSLSVQNKKGKFLNTIMCIYENKILKMVVKWYEEKYPGMTATLMFDGLYISSELPDQCETLNKITDEIGYIWTCKEGSDAIEQTDIFKNRDNLPAYEIKSYDVIKEKFEENHFMIELPLTYVMETTLKGKPAVFLYNAMDFKAVIKPIKYEVYNSGKLEKVSIFETWSGDENRRSYKQLDFIPEKVESKEIYNTFTGFDYADYQSANFIPSKKLIDYFNKTISTLVDHDEKSITWLIRYIADIFQHPTRLPGCAVLWKSRPGFGKDTILDCISKLLNKKYLFRTARPDDIFGSFNGVIANKLLIQLNEMEGRDGFANKEKLKNLITENRTKINEKNMKAYEQTNTSRIFICSNNTNPIEIPNGDRRYAVFEADRIKPQTSHFIEMRELMESDDELYSLFEYLHQYDLGDIALRDCRPITKAYKTMQSNSTHPFYTWLYEDVIDSTPQEIDEMFTVYKFNKNKTKLIISGEHIYKKYKEHMEDTEQPMYNFNQKRIMKDMLALLKCYNRKTTINSSYCWCYEFNLSDAKILLQEFINMDEEEEILDLDNDPEWN